MAERDQQVANICDDYNKPGMWIDRMTRGLLLFNPTESHLSMNAARIGKVVTVYELDDCQTESHRSIFL